MLKLPVRTWILNAAAVFSGRHGDVTRRAEQSECSRETVYQHARKVESRLAAAPDADVVAELRAENRRLREEIAGLRRSAVDRVLCDKPTQLRLATTAFAMGVSLRQVEDLLGILLPAAQVPDHSTLGHWVQAESRRAGAVLKALDSASAPRVRTLALDEIFLGRPTLVGIEPLSMAAVFCHNTADRKAATWAAELAPFSRLEFAVSDAAKGIAAAVAQVAAGRLGATDAGPTLEHGLDVFHTTMEAQRVLARHWRHTEAAWDAAEAADARIVRARAQGVDARGPAGPARAAWLKATAALERVEHQEAAWQRAQAALELFRPDGRLNDRAAAEAEIAAALPGLPGADWTKVRNFLRDDRSLTFLDRMHRRLEAAEPRREWREALVWRWWLRHRRATPSGPVMTLVQAVGRARRLTEAEQVSYDRIAVVLKDTVRAGSAVECMNSVLRMQQSRHRRMTQPMLDLKRLYWNCRTFRSGPRKDACPYQALGLDLPTFDFWELLRTDPGQLTQELSTQGNAD